MRISVQLELERPIGDRVEILDSEVRDPAAGVIGHIVGPGRINWNDGRSYLEITVEIDDDAAITAATRNGGPF